MEELRGKVYNIYRIGYLKFVHTYMHICMNSLIYLYHYNNYIYIYSPDTVSDYKYIQFTTCTSTVAMTMYQMHCLFLIRPHRDRCRTLHNKGLLLHHHFGI